MSDTLRWVFKHSPACPISFAAHREVSAFRAAHPDIPVETLDVFVDRDRCDAIEAATGVRHESPQVLLFEGETVRWHASHRRVTASHMVEATATRGASPVFAARSGLFG